MLREGAPASQEIKQSKTYRMKKLLLLTALAGLAFGASAETFGDSFRLEYNGKEYKDGETLASTEFEFIDPENPDWGGEYKNIDVNVINLTEDWKPVFVRIELGENTGGTYMNCLNNFYNSGSNSLQSNCIAQPFNQFFNVPTKAILEANQQGDRPMQLQLEASNMTSADPFRLEGKLHLAVASGDAADEPEIVEGTEITLNFIFDKDYSSVEEIRASGDAAAYYTIQGVRVDAPAENGLYIRVQDGKARKVLVK